MVADISSSPDGDTVIVSRVFIQKPVVVSTIGGKMIEDVGRVWGWGWGWGCGGGCGWGWGWGWGCGAGCWYCCSGSCCVY